MARHRSATGCFYGPARPRHLCRLWAACLMQAARYWTAAARRRCLQAPEVRAYSSIQVCPSIHSFERISNLHARDLGGDCAFHVAVAVGHTQDCTIAICWTGCCKCRHVEDAIDRRTKTRRYLSHENLIPLRRHWLDVGAGEKPSGPLRSSIDDGAMFGRYS